MKILIVSDTHRIHKNFLQVVKEVGRIDLLVHLGDIEGAEQLYSDAVDCPVEMVAGNNDYFSDLPIEKMVHIGPYEVMLTHGHRYYIGMGKEMLMAEARARGADIVMYGHTHRPVVEQYADLTVLNPGSLAYPRQDGKRPTYIIMEIGSDDKVHYELCYLGEE